MAPDEDTGPFLSLTSSSMNFVWMPKTPHATEGDHSGKDDRNGQRDLRGCCEPGQGRSNHGGTVVTAADCPIELRLADHDPFRDGFSNCSTWVRMPDVVGSYADLSVELNERHHRHSANQALRTITLPTE